jgi:hypothetical protein
LAPGRAGARTSGAESLAQPIQESKHGTSFAAGQRQSRVALPQGLANSHSNRRRVKPFTQANANSYQAGDNTAEEIPETFSEVCSG